ncbi:MAG: hypothetical protein Q9174_003788 [Haloplaca sp. 1 TL-2023]
MSRYLTPSKVGLVVLIDLYCDGLLPSSATIPVLSFLASHFLLASSKCTSRVKHDTNGDLLVSIGQLQSATIKHPSAIPGRTIWDLVLKRLWTINSLDALHVFTDGLLLLLEKPFGEDASGDDGLNTLRTKRILLSRNSPLGAFVRRLHLEFTRLQFSDAASLWKDLIVYRAPTLGFWKRRNPAARSQDFDINLQGYLGGTSSDLLEIVYGDLSQKTPESVNNSMDDLEKLYEHQIAIMQSSSTKHCYSPEVLSADKIRVGESGSPGASEATSRHGQAGKCDSPNLNIRQVKRPYCPTEPYTCL